MVVWGFGLEDLGVAIERLGFEGWGHLDVLAGLMLEF